MSIQNELASIEILDGRVLEVFKDRRKDHGSVRSGTMAQRRRPPMMIAPHIGTGRVWVARGWLAVDIEEAARWPKGYEMILQPLEFDEWYIVSLRASESLTATLGLGKRARAFHFRALLTPSPTELNRLRSVHLLVNKEKTAQTNDEFSLV